MRKRTIIQLSIDGILALIGLGDLFVPEVKSWIFAGVIWGIAVIWAIFILVLWINDRKIKKEKQVQGIRLNENVKSESDLKIYSKIEKIITYGNGTKNLTMTIKLVPIRPVTIDILALHLTGEKYDAKIWRSKDNVFGDVLPDDLVNITPLTITTPSAYIVFFDVPKESAMSAKDASIYAFANHKDHNSEPFEINFEV
jgi:hypothetical protein